jgi:hypothetical protein
MRRREFIGLIGGAAAWPLAARAQQASGMRRIGVLMGTAAEDAESKAELAGFRDSLAKLGWVEGSTIHIDYRFVANPDQYPILAKELIALRPEVILAQSTPVAAVLQRETRAIAIVFVNVSDPIGSGFVSSLARPGGNLTGVIAYEPGITGKWLAMLKEIAPHLTRAALVANPKTTAYDYFLRNAKAAGASLDIEVASTPINDVADLEPAIKSFASVADGALLTCGMLRSLPAAMSSSRSPPATDCRRFIRGVMLSRKVVSCRTALTSSMRSNKARPTSVVFCGGRTQLIYQSRCLPSTKPSSISRLPKRLAFQCHHRFWCALTR